jgi:hypothetical protein
VSKLSAELDRQVRKASKHRCCYCLTPQSLVSYKLEIEHILPLSKGGKSVSENLCLACRQCNLHKSAKVFGFDVILGKRVRLFYPNRQKWQYHFAWEEDQKSIVGKTPCGRATVYALKMNDEWQTTAREIWKLTGQFPPED